MDVAEIKINGLNELREEIKQLKDLVVFMQKHNLPKFLPVETIEKKFGLSRQQLNGLSKKGKLNKYRPTDRKIFYSTEELYQLMKDSVLKEFRPCVK